MKTFRFYWIGSDYVDGEGHTPEEAFANLGYGSGAVKALDYYKELKDVNNG